MPSDRANDPVTRCIVGGVAQPPNKFFWRSPIFLANGADRVLARDSGRHARHKPSVSQLRAVDHCKHFGDEKSARPINFEAGSSC